MKKDVWVKKTALFKEVYEGGKSIAARDLVLYYLNIGGESQTKVGFSIGKKVGGAVVRNKIKRRLKSIVTNELKNIKKGYALVFIGRPVIATRSFPEVQESLVGLVRGAGIYRNKK